VVVNAVRQGKIHSGHPKVGKCMRGLSAIETFQQMQCRTVSCAFDFQDCESEVLPQKNTHEKLNRMRD